MTTKKEPDYQACSDFLLQKVEQNNAERFEAVDSCLEKFGVNKMKSKQILYGHIKQALETKKAKNKAEKEQQKKELEEQQAKEQAEAHRQKIEREKEVLMQLKEGFVLDDNALPKEINHAFGFIQSEEKRLFYFGAFLPENVKRTDKKKGEIYSTRVLSPVIICETGKIISPIGSGLPVVLNTMTIRKNRWSMDSIKNFVSGKHKPVSFFEVYLAFKKIFDDLMFFEQAEYAEILAVWCMSTYLQELVDKTLIMKFEGQSGVAKSKAMMICANLSFNGRKFLNLSPATFFRYRHRNKSAILHEEAERLFAVKKNQDDSELVEYYNASYERGSVVPRCDEKNPNNISEFDPFGNLGIGSINPLRGALEKRCIVINLVKAPAGQKCAELDAPLPFSEDVQSARDFAYVCVLQNHTKFSEVLASLKKPNGLQNREWNISKPVLALCDCIDASSPKPIGLRGRIEKCLIELFDSRSESYQADSWEFLLAVELLKSLESEANKFGENFYSNEKMLQLLERAVPLNQNTDGKKHSIRTVTKLLSELGLSRFAGRSSDAKCRGYRNLGFFPIKDIFLRSGIIHEKPEGSP